jgi:UDP-2,3-diacylglucosamine pyrophosphatase LpxH
MSEKKRSVEIVVISDVHLGTYGSHAQELHCYLQSIKPGVLVLNGDIIDFWQFSKRYWPKHHMKVVKDIISMAAKGTKVYYITGNHDEVLRKFSGLQLGNLEIVNKLVLEINENRVWFFHGDVFDFVFQYSRWIEKLGAIGYDTLIFINMLLNNINKLRGKGKISFSRTVKENVKLAVTFISKFEQTAATLAKQLGYHAIVCGHIHHPEIKWVTIGKTGEGIHYLNSGDWVENLSSLEMNDGAWRIFRYSSEGQVANTNPDEDSQESLIDMDYKALTQMVRNEFYSQ